MPFILATALLIRVVMDICFKLAVQRVSGSNNTFFQSSKIVLKSAYFWLAMAISGLNFWLWIIVLSYYDLSFAYPLFGICFALIMLSGKLFFNEMLDRNKLVGIGFIFLSSLVLIFG
jgi:multidrug transporter EmrE-like cation transporter